MKESLEQWTKKVNRLVQARIVLSMDDLPDVCDITDLWEDGIEPKEAADIFLEEMADCGEIPEELI
jgi:hypothetical protein